MTKPIMEKIPKEPIPVCGVLQNYLRYSTPMKFTLATRRNWWEDNLTLSGFEEMSAPAIAWYLANFLRVGQSMKMIADYEFVTSPHIKRGVQLMKEKFTLVREVYKFGGKTCVYDLHHIFDHLNKKVNMFEHLFPTIGKIELLLCNEFDDKCKAFLKSVPMDVEVDGEFSIFQFIRELEEYAMESPLRQQMTEILALTQEQETWLQSKGLFNEDREWAELKLQEFKKQIEPLEKQINEQEEITMRNLRVKSRSDLKDNFHYDMPCGYPTEEGVLSWINKLTKDALVQSNKRKLSYTPGSQLDLEELEDRPVKKVCKEVRWGDSQERVYSVVNQKVGESKTFTPKDPIAKTVKLLKYVKTVKPVVPVVLEESDEPEEPVKTEEPVEPVKTEEPVEPDDPEESVMPVHSSRTPTIPMDA